MLQRNPPLHRRHPRQAPHGFVRPEEGDRDCGSEYLGTPRPFGGRGVRSAEATFSALSHCVFGSLYRASLDDLPRRLRLECCWFLCKRIDALSRFCGRLLDHYEFGESRHDESSGFLEFFVANFRQRLDDPLYVLPGHSVRVLLSNLLNELRLRHQFVGHVFSVLPNHTATTLS